MEEENLKIYHPNKIRENVYFSKIMLNNEEISFQIPKSQVEIIKSKQLCKIQIDDKLSNYIKHISKKVIAITSEKSKDFFGKEINEDDCARLYKNMVEDNVLTCFYDKNTYFFSRKKQLNIDDIEENVNAITIVKADLIVYTKTMFYVRWDIQQMKIKRKEEDKKELEEYSIRDLEEDDKCIDDDINDKVKELSFF